MQKYTATIKVNFDGMKGKKYPIYEIVTTRVTIKKENRLIDFNINEVVIKPIKPIHPQIRAFLKF